MTPSNAPISVWWDIENCNLPQKAPAHKSVARIRQKLNAGGYTGPAQIFAYCDATLLHARVAEGLSRTGVNLHHVPNGRKDASDKALLVDLLLWAMDHPPPAILLLISGDQDYSHALHSLSLRGYTILLAIPPETGCHLLASAADRVWQWRDIVLADKDPMEADLAIAQLAEYRKRKGKKVVGFAENGAKEEERREEVSEEPSKGVLLGPEVEGMMGLENEERTAGIVSEASWDLFLDYLKNILLCSPKSGDSKIEKLSSWEILLLLKLAITDRKLLAPTENLLQVGSEDPSMIPRQIYQSSHHSFWSQTIGSFGKDVVLYASFYATLQLLRQNSNAILKLRYRKDKLRGVEEIDGVDDLARPIVSSRLISDGDGNMDFSEGKAEKDDANFSQRRKGVNGATMGRNGRNVKRNALHVRHVGGNLDICKFRGLHRELSLVCSPIKPNLELLWKSIVPRISF